MNAALVWEEASDAEEIHALLLSSDSYQEALYGIPAPQRNIETTRRRVADRVVHVLRDERSVAAMFTLTSEPPAGVRAADFPHAERPVWLSRLAVDPGLLREGSLVGVRCVRRAIEIAVEVRADALRAEANPDLVATYDMLVLLGFVECGRPRSEGGRRRVYLQKPITGAVR